MTENEKRNRAINVRIDLLTEEEQDILSAEIKKAKKSIAPKARGTIVEGDLKSLPSKDSLSLDEGDE